MTTAGRRALGGAIALVAVVALAWATGLLDLLSWEGLRARRASLQAVVDAHPGASLLAYGAAYVLITASSLPVATPVTLLGAALFGFGRGLVVVSVAATAGSTLAAAASRWLFRDLVRARLARAVAVMDAGLARDGVGWLLAARLVPVMPFVVVNLVVGVSSVPLRTIAWTGLVGMLPGTAAYVWAGAALGEVREPRDLLSPSLWGALVALSVLPFVLRRVRDRWHARTRLDGTPSDPPR
ncbi:MAG: TVP38/TMEM64 family protein [Alphaproteobacteria bacterium]|nr:TVP38/TMEM64 family protein [Alphaproteobacteria bacterium]